MSAEYSVGQIRRAIASMRVANLDELEVERMLTAYASRIEADESAVPFCRVEDVDANVSHMTQTGVKPGDPLYLHPPAQAAQVDRARETPRRQQAVEMLLELGWTYNSERGWEEPSPTAEPVAQADTDSSAAIGPLAYSYRDCLKEANRPTASIATHPHSPDAADSGRVTEAMVEQAFQAMDAVFAVEFPNRYDGLSDADKAIACKGIRAALEAALAAQSQGDSDGMCNEDHPERRCICREEFGHRVCGTTPPASPAGVPEGMVLYSSGGTSRVNDYKIGDDIYTAHEEYARGWNACRKLAAAAPSATPEGGEVGL